MKAVLNRRSIASWGYLGTTTVCGFLMLLAASHALAPSYAGWWFTIQAGATFLMLVDLGGGYVMVREVAQAAGEAHGGDADGAIKGAAGHLAFSAHDHALLRRITAANLATSTAMGIGFVFYFLYAAPQAEARDVVIAWLLYYGSVAANVVSLPYRSYFEGIGLLHVERTTASLCHALASLLVILAALLFSSIILMGAGMLVGMLANLVVLRVLEAREAKRAAELGVIRHSFLEIARSSLGFVGVIAGAAATRSAFAPIVTAFLGSAALAPLFFVNRVTSMLSTAIGILVFSERAVFMRLFVLPTLDPARKHFKMLMLVNGGCSLIAGAGVALLGPWATHLLVGPKYLLPFAIYVILGIDLFFNAVSGACGHVVMAAGKNPFAITVPLSGVFTVAGLFWMVPQYGILGATLAPFIAGCLTSYWFNLYYALRILYGRDKLEPVASPATANV